MPELAHLFLSAAELEALQEVPEVIDVAAVLGA